MPFPRDLILHCPGTNGVKDCAHDDSEDCAGGGDGDTWMVDDPLPDEPGGCVDGFVRNVDFCACLDDLMEAIFGGGSGTHVEEGDYGIARELFGAWRGGDDVSNSSVLTKHLGSIEC